MSSDTDFKKMASQRVQSVVRGVQHGWAWLMQDKHREQAKRAQTEIQRAFTEHPKATGETYRQHLWFTATMSLRFLFCWLVLLIHGIFPFLFTKTASRQTEIIYLIMRRRIHKTRQQELDSLS